MNHTPRGNRLHIAFFGRRNAGKSSLINALTNQPVAIVSTVAGTTTDPVFKSMEILPIGPVVLIDTAGIDDEGELGALRVKRSREVLSKTDLVLLVLEAGNAVSTFEEEIFELCRERNVPVVIVLNKADQHPVTDAIKMSFQEKFGLDPVVVSTVTGEGITELKVAIIRSAPSTWDDLKIVGDLLQPGETAVLVIPVDKAAPKGRIILPQVQTMRDILDHGAISLVVGVQELKEAIAQFKKKPKIVITDSQAFLEVDANTPADILLTSFSILFARCKGDLGTLVAGAGSINTLQPGDKILMAEACTHHRVEDDIGRTKLPHWLQQKVGGELCFEWSSGGGFPDHLSDYKLIIHCGACMINRREMLARLAQARAAKVPIVNYGVCIAHLMGILPRALSPFPALQHLLLQDTNKITERRSIYG
ncbi:MAG TPA: [FeFe] hydrogenase H-cluster maturation GTPase HydF [Candidatus Limnocylindrales bacterium]|nr:[FeFe] hydrogenase H-cluster maturation GTPase HydF [Candidatus Limnocylindrales bacterium]